MPRLFVHLIDVGAGDSILMEMMGDDGVSRFGLIDSNDSTYFRSSYIFLKRFFELRDIRPDPTGHLFEFVVLTHEHADHAQGLKAIMRTWGTRRFWYPRSLVPAAFANLLKFAITSPRIMHHEAVDASKVLPTVGGCALEVLWPPPGHVDPNPNNNSVVLRVTNGAHEVLLTGDAEETVWQQMVGAISLRTRFFKVPHHGSVNGTLDSSSQPLWLNQCPAEAVLGISTHVVPHGHPDAAAIAAMDTRGLRVLRTDRHHHIGFFSDGVKVSYWCHGMLRTT